MPRIQIQPVTTVQNNPDGLHPDGRAGILRITEDGEAVGSGIIGNDDPLDRVLCIWNSQWFWDGF